MDNMAIQIEGKSKSDVEICAQKLFNNLCLLQQKINIVEKTFVSLNKKEIQPIYTLESNLYFVEIEELDITSIKEISKEHTCQIYVNFEYKTFSDDLVFNNGHVKLGALPEEYQMLSA